MSTVPRPPRYDAWRFSSELHVDIAVGHGLSEEGAYNAALMASGDYALADFFRSEASPRSASHLVQ